MKRHLLLSALLCLIAPEFAAAQAPKIDYARLPLAFEANEGQTDPRVRFLSRRTGYAIFLTRDAAVLSLRPPTKRPKDGERASALGSGTPESTDDLALRLKFAGANRELQIEGIDELSGKSNYFIGNDPAKWRTNVPTYARVKYHDIYPGVDLAYHSDRGELEQDFTVEPGAHVQTIRLLIAGAQRLSIDAHGNLAMRLNAGELLLRKPVIYQIHEGAKQLIEGHYVLKGKREVGFQVAAYDGKVPLIIDPVLSYSTYLGGSSGPTVATGIAVDAVGNAYVTGPTNSVDFPTTLGSYQPTAPPASTDAFISKISPDGKSLVYSTFLGSSLSGTNTGTSAISLDTAGNVYVVGSTGATDFPTLNALQTSCNQCPAGTDTFITKLNTSGSALLYSSYFGGSSRDFANSVAVDNLGGAYVTGDTVSTDFPTTPGAIQTICGTDGTCNANVNGPVAEVFVAKFDTTKSGLASLLYSTYLGGNGSGMAIASDSAGNAYVTGVSSNIPVTPQAFQQQCGCSSFYSDAFVAKINSTGTSLVYATYLGGIFSEFGYGIAVDSAGSAYVTGATSSGDFPTTLGAFQTASPGGTSAFVTKLNSNGSGLVYSTYLGAGTGFAEGDGIVVDGFGNAYVVGRTSATNFPIMNAIQSNFAGGFSDIFVSKLNSSGSQLLFSTYLGGSDDDGSFAGWFEKAGLGIAVGSTGDAYVAGATNSTDYPTTPGVIQTALAGTVDAVVTRISGLPGSSGPSAHILTVMSSNPATGVSITASPSDNNGLSNGITPFALTYSDGAVVTLTAPTMASGNNFSNWTGCDSALITTCTVTMSADRTVIANYVTTLPTIASVYPTSGTLGQTITNFTVTGANFDPASMLSFSGNPGDVLVSGISSAPTLITATLNIAPNAVVGPRDVVVTAAGQPAATKPGGFTVLLRSSTQGCNIQSLKVDYSRNNGNLHTAWTAFPASPCQFQIEIENATFYWTQFNLRHSGGASFRQIEGDPQLLAPATLSIVGAELGPPAKFIIQLTSPGDYVQVSVDPTTVSAIEMNDLQILITVVGEVSKEFGIIVGSGQLVSDDIPLIINAFKRMPHLSASFTLNPITGATEFSRFLRSKEEVATLNNLITTLAVGFDKDLINFLLSTPKAVADLLLQIGEGVSKLLLGITQGQVTFTGQ